MKVRFLAEKDYALLFCSCSAVTKPVDSFIEAQSNSDALGLKENHFSYSEDYVDSYGSIEALKEEIDKYKTLAISVTPKTNEGKEIVRRLVQLRLKLVEYEVVLSDIKERNVSDEQELRQQVFLKVMVVWTNGVEFAENESSNAGDIEKYHIMGHNFEKHSWSRAKGYCERCNSVILSVIQPWCLCSNCGYCCHKRCMNNITRMCVITKVNENPSFTLVICPERGLQAQNYRCADCRAPIGFQPGLREPRLCDYSGLYFCNYCHWNDAMCIPARIIANWDFQPKRISRVSKQYLKLMINKPVLHIQNLNPMLFRYLEELCDVKQRREEILIMKEYFMKCPLALGSKLLCQLSNRQHFVDNADMFSLQDLVDLANDVLLPELTRIHASLAQHIKSDCQVCRSTGRRCQLCNTDEDLFPFDSFAFVCSDCSTVYHRHCYMTSQSRGKCVVCFRRRELT